MGGWDDLSLSIYGERDDGPDGRLATWIRSKTVWPFIEELKCRVNFGTPDAKRSVNKETLLQLCVDNENIGRYIMQRPKGFEEFDTKEHYIRAIGLIIRENSYTGQVLAQDITYRRKCEIVLELISRIRQDHSISRRGRFQTSLSSSQAAMPINLADIPDVYAGLGTDRSLWPKYIGAGDNKPGVEGNAETYKPYDDGGIKSIQKAEIDAVVPKFRHLSDLVMGHLICVGYNNKHLGKNWGANFDKDGNLRKNRRPWGTPCTMRSGQVFVVVDDPLTGSEDPEKYIQKHGFFFLENQFILARANDVGRRNAFLAKYGRAGPVMTTAPSAASTAITPPLGFGSVIQEPNLTALIALKKARDTMRKVRSSLEGLSSENLRIKDMIAELDAALMEED